MVQGEKIEMERRANDWRATDMERELKLLGIPILGRGFTKPSEIYERGTVIAYVPQQQHRWAEYSLRRAGCPVLTVVDPRNEAWAQGKGPIPAWGNRPAKRRQAPKRAQARRQPQQRGAVRQFLHWLIEGED